MKELAEQAATGTYNSTQRLDYPFRISADGNGNRAHCPRNRLQRHQTPLTVPWPGNTTAPASNATGKMKIHFGTGNESAEDYYYVEIGNCTLAGLGLRDEAVTATKAARWQMLEE